MDNTPVGNGLNDPMYDPNGAPILGYYVIGGPVRREWGCICFAYCYWFLQHQWLTPKFPQTRSSMWKPTPT